MGNIERGIISDDVEYEYAMLTYWTRAYNECVCVYVCVRNDYFNKYIFDWVTTVEPNIIHASPTMYTWLKVKTNTIQ